MIRRLLFICGFLVASYGSAWAHLASDSYLRLDLGSSTKPEQTIIGQWDIAVRDLDVAVGLDANADGTITWGELRTKKLEVERYAFSHLSVGDARTACTFQPGDLQADFHAGSGYAVLHFLIHCPPSDGAMDLTYRLLFDLDPTHRGLLTIVGAGKIRTDVLRPERSTVTLTSEPNSFSTEVRRFLQFGFDHILFGYDHLLFVAVLLFTASLRRDKRKQWVPIKNLRDVLLQTFKILTAFTIAHGFSLTLAVLGFIEAPSRLIDPAIALTIILASIDNGYPVLPGIRWKVAFAFGLVHGLAFAAALGPMKLPPLRLGVALGCFNLGVEAGQIALALLLVPIAFALREERAYRQFVAPGLSAIAGLLATFWLIDRVFALDLLSLTQSGQIFRQ